MLKVCASQCDQCLFSKNRIVSEARMKEILKDCTRKDTYFICHKGTITGEEIICAGFYEKFSSQMIRIAGRLNCIEFVKPENIIEK
jgi:hypothetical protein